MVPGGDRQMVLPQLGAADQAAVHILSAKPEMESKPYLLFFMVPALHTFSFV
jgi:hypothetical protein